MATGIGKKGTSSKSEWNWTRWSFCFFLALSALTSYPSVFRKKIFLYDLLHNIFYFQKIHFKVCFSFPYFSTGFRWSRIRYWFPSCLSRRKNLSFWTKKIRWSSHVSNLLFEFPGLNNTSGLSAGQGNLVLLMLSISIKWFRMNILILLDRVLS